MLKSVFLKSIIVLLLATYGFQNSYTQPCKPEITNLNERKYQDLTFNDLIKKYKGKVVYIDFWASWCKPCLKEMDNIKNIQDHFQGKNFSVIFISPERNADAWQSKINELQIEGDHYLTNKRIWDEIKKELNLTSIPRYVLINKRGRIVNKDAEEPGHPDIIKEIETLL